MTLLPQAETDGARTACGRFRFVTHVDAGAFACKNKGIRVARSSPFC